MGVLMMLYSGISFVITLAVLVGFCKCGAEAAMDEAMDEIIDMMEEERMVDEKFYQNDVSHAPILRSSK